MTIIQEPDDKYTDQNQGRIAVLKELLEYQDFVGHMPSQIPMDHVRKLLQAACPHDKTDTESADDPDGNTLAIHRICLDCDKDIGPVDDDPADRSKE